MPPAATPSPAGSEHVAAFRRRGTGATAACDVVPTASGARLFRKSGWRGFQAAIAPWAAAAGLRADAVRVVSALPPAGADDAAGAVAPRVTAVAAPGERVRTLTLAVPFELAIFRGHFPTAPIVPGAMLAGWAAALAAEHAGWAHGARASRAMKFRRVVQPGPEYRLRLSWSADAQQLDFRYESEHGMHAEGVLQAPPA